MSLLSETNAKAPVRKIGGLRHLARFCLLAGTLISGNGEESDYRAATAWIDITPQELPIRMAGSMRPSQANIIHDPLRARLILIATEKTKIILGTLDHCVLPEAVFQPIALAVEEATQIPASHITLSATHTHSAPPLTGLFLNDPERTYSHWMIQRVTHAMIQLASKPLEPVRIAWDSVDAPNHVFNRRWHLKEGIQQPNPLGSLTDRVRMNPGYGNPEIVQPAGPVDSALSLLAISRLDGSPMAIYANYALHYVGGVSGISADYFGAYNSMLTKGFTALYPRGEFLGILSNGSSGDINNLDFSLREAPPRLPLFQKIESVAQDLATRTISLYPQLKWQHQGPLQCLQTNFNLAVRQPNPEEISKAKQIVQEAEQTGKDLWKQDQIYARETLLLAEGPKQVNLTMNALRIGDGCMLTLPAEVFCEIGIQLKKTSLATHTMVIELANGYHGYLPSPEQHALGGYETWRARSSYLEVNASIHCVKALQHLQGGLWVTLSN